jgi:prepilin-type N-terminal cleavage/methylation domain-containing protein
MMFMSLKNRKGGFTLIELLVVIAIIGILSAVVLASLSTARQKSRDAKRISDVGQIQLGLELQFDSNQSYPRTNQVAGTTAGDGGVILLVNNNFLPSLPVPPSGSSPKYQYRGLLANTMPAPAAGECVATTDTCTSYMLGVNLERTDNTVLTSDADSDLTLLTAAFANGAVAINTASGKLSGIALNTTVASGCGNGAGTAQPSGTEQCYDVKP